MLKDRLVGLRRTSRNELECVDEKIMKNYEGVVADVLKRLAKVLAKGEGIIGISLPIRIF